MKKEILSRAVAAAGMMLAVGTAAFGQTVNVDRIQGVTGGINEADYGGNNPNPTGLTAPVNKGGEFTVIPTDASLLSNYVLGTTAPGTQTGTKVTDPGDNGTTNPDAGLAGDVGFQTFCLEVNTELTPIPTGPISYALSESVLNGGTKPLTIGTCYLYSLFAQGKLSNYDYVDYLTDSGGNPSARGNDAAYLQAAFWYLQGDILLSAADGMSNPYLSDLVTAGLLSSSGTSGTALVSATTTAEYAGVEVLNLGTSPSYNQQALLVYKTAITTSVPDGGTTVMLMGMALGGLELLRRKFLA